MSRPGIVACGLLALIVSTPFVASEAGGEPDGLYLGSQRTWFFISFLDDDGDDASTLGVEFESYFDSEKYTVKNISYFERNDFPRPIPASLRAPCSPSSRSTPASTTC